jgi:hypothetical protein
MKSKNIIFYGSNLCLCALIVGLASCTPVLSDIQSARHLTRGQLEVTPSTSFYHWTKSKNTNQLHGGVQAGYGVTSRIELRARLETVNAGLEAVDTTFVPGKIWAQTFALGVKYSLFKDKLSLYVPVGFGVGKEIEERNTWMIQPTLIYTKRYSKYVEFSPSLKFAQTFNSKTHYYGVNFGFGLSANLDRWVIRPEFGFFGSNYMAGSHNHVSLGFSWRGWGL